MFNHAHALNVQGYWKNDKATRETMTADGWLKTGDIAFADKDGFMTFIDRKKELIKYKVSKLYTVMKISFIT